MVSFNLSSFSLEILPIVKASSPNLNGIRMRDSLMKVVEVFLITRQKSKRIALLPISIEANLRLSLSGA